jgi:hypothetical protein
MSTINLQSPTGVAPEKDELNRSEKSDAFRRMARHRKGVIEELKIIKQLNQQDRESLGLEDAYIDKFDLIDIIEDLLANKLPVSKLFQRHEVSKNKCRDWAKRTIKDSVDKLELSSALDTLASSTGLILMEKYKVLDVTDITRPASYSAALTKLKKQLAIAHTFQDKDDELNNKDIVIAAKNAEIEKLKEELVRNKSADWEQQALKLRQMGISVTEIAERLSKARGSVSTYLNLPSVKAQILKRPIQA